MTAYASVAKNYGDALLMSCWCNGSLAIVESFLKLKLRHLKAIKSYIPVISLFYNSLWRYIIQFSVVETSRPIAYSCQKQSSVSFLENLTQMLFCILSQIDAVFSSWAFAQ